MARCVSVYMCGLCVASGVCVCLWQAVCVCVCLWEAVCVCVCVWQGQAGVCVCVCGKQCVCVCVASGNGSMQQPRVSGCYSTVCVSWVGAMLIAPSAPRLRRGCAECTEAGTECAECAEDRSRRPHTSFQDKWRR